MSHLTKTLLLVTLLLGGVAATSAANAAPIGIGGYGSTDLTKKQKLGGARCAEWCILHNKTEASLNKCLNQCDDYWSTHQG